MGRAQVTRQEWLDAGIECFGKAGLAGLRVEAMARSLGSSKAGFYWYFTSRKQFENELFDHWRAEQTQAVIEASQGADTPLAKLLQLVETVVQLRHSGDFTFHLRRLARRRKSVARLLRETEAERLGYLTSVLVELGKTPNEAGEMAEVIYHFYLGWYERNHLERITPERRKQLVRIVGQIAGVALERRRAKNERARASPPIAPVARSYARQRLHARRRLELRSRRQRR